MTQEVWKPVAGYDGLYEVSNQGRVRSYYVRGHTKIGQTPRVLRPGDVRGYQQIILRKDCQSESGLVHRLVAIAFIGPAPTPDHEVNHLDFDKSNNRPENLEWVTHADNNRYSAPVIQRLHGEQIWWSKKLTEHSVREIRRRHAANEANFTQLAREFGVSLQTVSSIVKRRKWKHVA